MRDTAPGQRVSMGYSRGRLGRAGSMGKRVYADEADTVILSSTSGILHEWVQFEEDVFTRLGEDPEQQYGVLLNVGSGRRITEPEQPFFDRFATWYLLEPDEERRAALADQVAGRAATLLGDRIEDLDVAALPPADFVLCKYVLQHIDTSLIGPATQQLRAAAAPGATIGLFLAVTDSDESRFRIVIPEAAADDVPRKLRRRTERTGAQLATDLTQEQFDDLIGGGAGFPFIATHHFGRRELAQRFPEFVVTGTATGVAFLQARV